MTPRKAWQAKAADGLIETRTLDDPYVRVYQNRLAITPLAHPAIANRGEKGVSAQGV